MKNNKEYWLLGFVLLCLVGLVFWVIFSSSTNDIKITVAILSIVGSLIVSLISQYIQREKDLDIQDRIKNREIDSRLFENKAKNYEAFFDFFFFILKNNKDIKYNKSEEYQKNLNEKATKYKKNMILWSSSDTINAWNDYLSETMFINKAILETKNTEKLNKLNMDLLLAGDNLFKAIRKDMGHDDKSLKEMELMKMILDSNGQNAVDKRNKNI